MEHCCQSIAGVKEYPTDELIEHIVRSQELARRIFDAFSYDDLNNGEIRGELIVTLTSDAFIRDLDRLQLALPRDLQQNGEDLFKSRELRTFLLQGIDELHSYFNPRVSRPTDSNPRGCPARGILGRSKEPISGFTPESPFRRKV
jgi:hypothetical protein